MANATLAWSFKNRLDVLKQSISTADSTCPKDVEFLLIDANSSRETVEGLRDFIKTFSRNIRIAESFSTSSLSEAWNLATMLSSTKYIIFSSSDVLFLKSGWYELLFDYANLGNKYIILSNHSVFMLNKIMIPIVGWFDEGFKAGPHFDCDYMIRASEKGVAVCFASNDGFYAHEDSSDTTRLRLNTDVPDRLPMNTDFNEIYFKSKWQSGWPGWSESIKKGELHMPHPPVEISQVTRLVPEVDPHPLHTKRIACQYLG
jgi:hypothetical protein